MKEVEKHDEKETNNSTLIALTSSKFLACDEKKSLKERGEKRLQLTFTLNQA